MIFNHDKQTEWTNEDELSDTDGNDEQNFSKFCKSERFWSNKKNINIYIKNPEKEGRVCKIDEFQDYLGILSFARRRQQKIIVKPVSDSVIK